MFSTNVLASLAMAIWRKLASTNTTPDQTDEQQQRQAMAFRIQAPDVLSATARQTIGTSQSAEYSDSHTLIRRSRHKRLRPSVRLEQCTDDNVEGHTGSQA